VSDSNTALASSGLADDLELVGTIVRLQVQASSLKCGEKPHRWYDPEPIRSVPGLRIDDGGATGFDGVDIADVHHRDHPQSKFRGENGLSVGFTGHYARMRSRFGDHLLDGIAGENILVDADHEYTDDDVALGIVIQSGNGPISLAAVQAAPPCVEFSKFCAGYTRDQRPDRVITETLRFLNDGMRGFYATLQEDAIGPVRIAVGDLVYRRVR
jgi:hypothetical protein